MNIYLVILFEYCNYSETVKYKILLTTLDIASTYKNQIK